jgi:hypothetical protein
MALLGVLLFWCGVVLAAGRYPSEYDWRFMPISNLLSAARNPAGYVWATAGVVACGLCGLCWAAAPGLRGIQAIADNRCWGLWSLRLGNLGIVFSAAPGPWLLRMSKGHELLVVLAFAGLCLGVTRLMFRVLVRAFQHRMRSSVRRQRLCAALLAGIVVLPILLSGLAQAYVFYALPQLHWVSLAWRAQGIPVYLSFAFWEWVTCAVLSAYTISLAVMSATVAAA